MEEIEAKGKGYGLRHKHLEVAEPTDNPESKIVSAKLAGDGKLKHGIHHMKDLRV